MSDYLTYLSGQGGNDLGSGTTLPTEAHKSDKFYLTVAQSINGTTLSPGAYIADPSEENHNGWGPLGGGQGWPS